MIGHRRITHYALIVIVLNAVLLSGLLWWTARLRYADFQANQAVLMRASGLATANQVSQLIRDLRRKLSVFTSFQTPLIASAARNDPGAADILTALVIEYFQDYLGFAIADTSGNLTLSSLDPPLGETCQTDLRSYAHAPQGLQVYVHPDPEGYHFDLMQLWQDESSTDKGIFFISVNLDSITHLLRNAQLPDQRLVLIKRGSDLLELDALGSRLQHPVEQHQLSAADMANITYTQPITDTLWDLVVIPDMTAEQDYQRQLGYDTGRALALVLVLTLFTLGLTTYLQRRLARTQAQLIHSEKLAALGQMVAGVAHEMNTPLAYIRSNLELWIDTLQQGSDTPDWHDPETWQERQELAQTSLEGVDHIAGLVRSLKDFSRIDRATQTLYSLHEGLENTLRIARLLLRNVKITQSYAPDLPLVPCAPSQIHQVLLNLVSNAAQAMPGGGDLRLETGFTATEVWVKISDTGSGINPDHLKQLGEPFFTTKAQGQGLGLGLAISYSIIKNHQGRIEVHSELGKGTQFTVWLPRPTPTAA